MANTWGIGQRVESIHAFTAYNVRSGDKGTVAAVARGGAVRVFMDRINAGRWFSADQLRASTTPDLLQALEDSINAAKARRKEQSDG